MRGGSPVLNENTFQSAEALVGGRTMTIQGTVNRAGFLLCLVVVAAGYTWWQFLSGSQTLPAWMLGGLLGGFVLALVICFKPTTAPMLSPVYAICEGLFLGAVSGVIQAEIEQPIVVLAIMLTFGIVVAALLAYTTRLIRVTQGFRRVIVTATLGVCLVYVVSLVARYFGYQVPMIHDAGAMGIAFSLVVVGIAAFNLFLDFDLIERGAESGAPKYMEWYGAFALLVTIVWLYLEVLRLLAKLNRR